MENENFIKLRFAVEYYKRGKNAAEAGRAFGKSRQWAHKMKKDPVVVGYMSELEQLIGLDKLSQAETDTIKSDIADINEILTILTVIARGERSEDAVVVVKERKTEWIDDKKTTTETETPTIVRTTTKNADIIRAASELMKYLTDTAATADTTETGVVLIPERKKD